MEKTERKTKRAYMYVVECADGTLYTGYTTDVERRIKTHNAGKGAKYTKSRLPVKLIYQESFDSKEAAMSAESYFKQNRFSFHLMCGVDVYYLYFRSLYVFC